MTTKYIFISCLLIIAGLTSAQQDNHWFFGFKAGLDFTSGSPIPVLNGELNSTEAAGSMSDSAGNLLFYTNGRTVWNKEHTIMENGEGLLGNTSSTQSGLILPKPGDSDTYYIFTADAFMGPDGLKYSVVDLTANGGLGNVVEKNINMLTPTCEKMAAVYHANGTDIWLLTHQWGSNAFYAYLLTVDDISPIPVISNSGDVIEGDFIRSAGCMKFSPDGTKLAVANNEVSFQLFDFDAATGMVYDPLTLITAETCYGVEFSPTGNALYLAQWDKVSQFDLEAGDIAASQTTLLELPQGAAGTLQLGPDSKIYLSHWDKPQLTVINKPDIIGVGCDLQLLSLYLGGRLSWWGLPCFLTSSFYVADIVAVPEDCGGQEVVFSLLSTDTAEIATWDFGDGSSASGLNPVHHYANEGTYIVNVTVISSQFTRYYTKEINVDFREVPLANTPQDMYLCDQGNNGSEVFDLSLQDAAVLGSQLSGDFSITYHATLVEAESATGVLPDNYVNEENPQTIYARIVANTGGCYALASFTLNATACILEIPKGISPNNDQKNDELDLAALDIRHLSIYNRYGIEVYSKENYTSQWHGQADNGGELPDGTYYYRADSTGKETKTGWIFVIRKL